MGKLPHKGFLGLMIWEFGMQRACLSPVSSGAKHVRPLKAKLGCRGVGLRLRVQA